MTKKLSSLKREARLLLQDKYSFLALATLLIAFCNMMLSYLVAFAVPVISDLFQLALNFAFLIVTNMIYTLLLGGTSRLYLNIVQHQPFGFRDLLFAFQNHPEPIAAYSVLTLIVQYGSLYLIAALYRSVGSLPLLVGLSLAVCALLLWFRLTYTAVLFLHASGPWRSLRELMRESRRMMHGHRLRFFRLELTFLGVILLGILSLGIGMLFVVPYMTMTHTLFYLNLQERG